MDPTDLSAQKILKSLKMLGGGIIVATAFAIMFPAFMTYLAGIGRLAIYVGATLALAAIGTTVFARLKTSKPHASSVPAESPSVNNDSVRTTDATTDS